MTVPKPGVTFNIRLEVRDYECDIQGIVNNAVYLNYFEHARHRFMHHIGLDFAKCVSEGVMLVVRRSEIDYLRPLKSGDTFDVTIKTEQVSRLRCLFHQRIIRVSDNTATTQAKFLITGTNRRGAPYLPREIMDQITHAATNPA